MLLVYPDFSRQDIAAILASVSGSYPGFERKLIYKFNDTSDVFRPSYTAGSNVAMAIFYIGTDSPGDLLSQVFALLRFIRHPVILTSLPAPIDLKVRPVLKSDDALAQGGLILEKFKDFFDADFEKSLSLEWRMPMAPAAGNAPGFVNSIVSFYNSFRFPNFVIERSELPTGEIVEVDINTPSTGKILSGPLERFNLQKPVSKAIVKEPDEVTTYRHFSNRSEVGTAQVVRGNLNGTYRFIDTSPELEMGKAYYYRVRAFFGKPTNWLTSTPGDMQQPGNQFIRFNGTKASVYYGDNVVMGRASAITRGVVPRKVASGLNLYKDIFNAVMAGVLLNFELPAAASSDSPFTKEQKTGWGSLSMLGGMIAPYKAVLDNSDDIKNSLFVKAAVRHVVNQVITNLYVNTRMTAYLNQQWADGVQETVSRLIDPVTAQSGVSTNIIWKFPKYTLGDVVSGFTQSALDRINAYLALEASYTDGMADLSGPYPTGVFKIVQVPVQVTVEQREALAQFIGTALSALSTTTSYLHWYSVTLGDLFPAFLPFIYDFEQFILALLKALESALKEIRAIIETLLQKIKQLEQILEQILAIIDLLNINVKVSVLGTSSSNGSVDSLVETIQTAEQKPTNSPFGLHSGIVLTAGGPGQGSTQAIKALAFVLGIKIEED